MDTLLEMLGSFASAMLMPRWLIVACALAATLMVVWGMTGIALFVMHRLSGWLLRTCFGVQSGAGRHKTSPRPADSDIHAPKPADVRAVVRSPIRPLQDRLSELGVGKGWKLKVTLPKRPKQ